MMQTLTCSPEAPCGNHPTLRDNVCPRCGWAAPDLSALPDCLAEASAEAAARVEI
jgi:hypothetical protein